MPDTFQDITAFKLVTLGKTAITLGGVMTALIIVVIASLAAKLAGAGIRRLRTRAGRNGAAIYIFEKLATYGLVIAGVFMALSTMGLDFSSLALFAGAIGVGVGLGLQGVVKEFVSGLVLIFDRVVNIGDYIELESGQRGLVQEIGPRATRLRTNDNIDVLIPNSKLVENQVTNWTLHGQTRRIHVPFSVAYEADRDKVREAVLEAARAVPFTLPDDGVRKSQVWLTGFGDSALNFELLVWPTLEAVKRPASMHAAYTWAIDEALRRACIEIPFPQRDLRIRNLFGHEGAEALKALKLAPAEPPRPPPPSEAPNDAAEDLMQGDAALSPDTKGADTGT